MPALDRTTRPGWLRVSDAEREQVAARVRDAAGVGMLTLAEADERQAAAYAARIRADLAELTDDLPAAPTREPAEPDLSLPLEPRVRRRLAVHAALAVGLAAVLIARWALGPEPWFGPVDRCSGSHSAWCCTTAGSATAECRARPTATPASPIDAASPLVGHRQAGPRRGGHRHRGGTDRRLVDVWCRLLLAEP